jgi:hypothetical protein
METYTENLELRSAENVYEQFGITNVETLGWDPLDDEDEPDEDEPIEEINIDDDEPFDDEEDADDFDIDQS